MFARLPRKPARENVPLDKPVAGIGQFRVTLAVRLGNRVRGHGDSAGRNLEGRAEEGNLIVGIPEGSEHNLVPSHAVAGRAFERAVKRLSLQKLSENLIVLPAERIRLAIFRRNVQRHNDNLSAADIEIRTDVLNFVIGIVLGGLRKQNRIVSRRLSAHAHKGHFQGVEIRGNLPVLRNKVRNRSRQFGVVGLAERFSLSFVRLHANFSLCNGVSSVAVVNFVVGQLGTAQNIQRIFSRRRIRGRILPEERAAFPIKCKGFGVERALHGTDGRNERFAVNRFGRGNRNRHLAFFDDEHALTLALDVVAHNFNPIRVFPGIGRSFLGRTRQRHRIGKRLHGRFDFGAVRQTVIDNARPRRFHTHFQFCYRQSKVFFADILFGIHRNVQAIGSCVHDFAFDFRAVLAHKIGGDGQFFKGDIRGQKGRNDRTAVCIGTLFKFGGKNFSNLEFGDHVPRHFKGEITAFGRLLFTVQKKAIEPEPLFDIIVHGNFIAALCRRGIADQCSALYRRVGHDMIVVRIHFERKALHFAHIAGGIYRRNLQVIFTVRDVKRIFACGQFTACVRRRAAV